MHAPQLLPPSAALTIGCIEVVSAQQTSSQEASILWLRVLRVDACSVFDGRRGLPPERPQLLLASHIPDSEDDILVLNLLYVEA
jgi:hypothetical protein